MEDSGCDNKWWDERRYFESACVEYNGWGKSCFDEARYSSASVFEEKLVTVDPFDRRLNWFGNRWTMDVE